MPHNRNSPPTWIEGYRQYWYHRHCPRMISCLPDFYICSCVLLSERAVSSPHLLNGFILWAKFSIVIILLPKILHLWPLGTQPEWNPVICLVNGFFFSTVVLDISKTAWKIQRFPGDSLPSHMPSLAHCQHLPSGWCRCCNWRPPTECIDHNRPVCSLR